MVLKRVVVSALLAGLVFGACLPPDDGGGGGNGTDLGIDVFTMGFLYLRADNRDVYVTDVASNYMESARLTDNGNNRHPSLSADRTTAVFVHQDGESYAIQTALLAGSLQP